MHTAHYWVVFVGMPTMHCATLTDGYWHAVWQGIIDFCTLQNPNLCICIYVCMAVAVDLLGA